MDSVKVMIIKGLGRRKTLNTRIEKGIKKTSNGFTSCPYFDLVHNIDCSYQSLESK